MSDARPVSSDVTNNVCEYTGLIMALKFLMSKGWHNKSILILMDA